MGLDMYLTGEKLRIYDWENPQNNEMEDGFRVKSRELDLGYWRKHPDLHGFIVESFANGVDECQRIRLEIGDIMAIIRAIEENSLPHTEGFFFGESENDEDQKAEAIGIFRKAFDWMRVDNEGEFRSVIYQSSW